VLACQLASWPRPGALPGHGPGALCWPASWSTGHGSGALCQLAGGSGRPGGSRQAGHGPGSVGLWLGGGSARGSVPGRHL